MRSFFALVVLSLYSASSAGQYISRSEPVPYNCPSTCAGGSIILKVPQVQNLPNGAVVQALLSNAAGSFASGTTVLNSTRYSLNQGTNWTNGSFVFSSNVNDLYFEITIPVSQPSGSNYTIKMQSSSGYVSNDLFQCNGGNKIIISAGYTPLAGVPVSQQGSGQWVAHVYTWTPNTTQVLSTDALASVQDFYNSTNYKGHFLKNNLDFDVNYQLNGAVCPGPLNVLHDGTSIPCSQGYSTNFSVRLLRQENFSPGLYRFEIGADDGIRLSINGGASWLLNSFYEQTYSASVKNTDAQYPNGVCLSGTTNLVIEYFQRPVDARLTFTSTMLSPSISNPANQTICEGDNTSFSTTSINSYTYQWEYSANGGATFAPAVNGANFSGVTSSALSVNSTPVSFDNYYFRCRISGPCGNPVYTDSALLQVEPAANIQSVTGDTAICEGGTATFSVSGSGSAFQWFVSSGGNFAPVIDNGTFSESTTPVLQISGAPLTLNGNSFFCRIMGCNGELFSDTLNILVFGAVAITSQPVDVSLCDADTAIFSISYSGDPASIVWQRAESGSTIFTDINGANQPQLTITPVLESDDEAQFRCVIAGCNGSVVSSIATIDLCEKEYSLAIPQAFSPNGDGTNDYFEVFGNKNAVATWFIYIYNRWGEQVFSSTDINFKWDGSFRGRQQPVGTFVYTASAKFQNGQQQDYKGNLTIVR